MRNQSCRDDCVDVDGKPTGGDVATAGDVRVATGASSQRRTEVKEPVSTVRRHGYHTRASSGNGR